MIHSSYSKAQNNFNSLFDKVIDDADVVIIERQEHERVAMISADVLERMQETLYILSSPENARLIEVTVERAARGLGERSNSTALRKEFGLEE